MTTVDDAPVAASATGELERSLGLFHIVGVVLSGAAPAVTVFLYVPVLYYLVGTFSFMATLIGTVIAFGMALIYAELTTAYPSAGGEYVVLGRVVGKSVGFVVFLIQTTFFVMLTATYAVGLGMQLQTVWAGAPVKAVGLCALGVGVILAFFRLKMSARLTATLVGLQLVAVAVVTVIGLVHAQQPYERLVHITAYGPDGTLMPITWSFILLGLTVAFFNMTGFNSAAQIAEEVRDVRRQLPRAYIIAVVVLTLTVLIPTGAVLLGAPSLEALLTSPAPMTYLMDSFGIGGFTTFVNLAVAVAMLNAIIALVVVCGRVLWSASRDGALPGPLSRWVAYVSPRSRTPIVATTIMAVLAGFSMFSNTITGLVTLTGFITIVWFALMALGAIWLRFKKDAPPDHYRLPLGPVIPAVILVAFAVFATGQTQKDLLIVLGTVTVALVYYFAYLYPRRARRWRLLDAAAEDEV